jgi:hypothetical protein
VDDIEAMWNWNEGIWEGSVWMTTTDCAVFVFRVLCSVFFVNGVFESKNRPLDNPTTRCLGRFELVTPNPKAKPLGDVYFHVGRVFREWCV